MNVRELKEKAEIFLQEKNIEDSILNVDLLLANILKIQRFDLYLDLDRPLSSKELELFRNYIKRRIQGEPLQYILGSQQFLDFEFYVNPKVLIPRPETELLIEIATSHIINPSSLLDIGTGCGAIAISLARKFKDASVIAIDISEDALEIAEANAQKYNISNIIFKKYDALDPQFHSYFNQVDAILSNPPYIPIAERHSLQKEIKDYEPSLALFTKTGLEFYEKICSDAKMILKREGHLFFEIHDNTKSDIMKIMTKNNLSSINVFKDLNNIPRVVAGKLP